MKILITGAKGFIGKNLIDRLKRTSTECEIYSFDIDNTKEDLYRYTKDCDFVFNFAAVHRPKNVQEFENVNHVFFDDLLNMLKEHCNYCPVLYTSSIQATNGSEYGNSKLSAEADLIDYEKETGGRAIIYRLTNVFGRWATPNHHSVVATFCYNLVHNIPLQISDRNHMMHFYYIDDVIDSFILQLTNSVNSDEDGIYRLSQEKVYSITLGGLADILTDIKNEVAGERINQADSPLKEKLRETYLSYYNQYTGD